MMESTGSGQDECETVETRELNDRVMTSPVWYCNVLMTFQCYQAKLGKRRESAGTLSKVKIERLLHRGGDAEDTCSRTYNSCKFNCVHDLI